MQKSGEQGQRESSRVERIGSKGYFQGDFWDSSLTRDSDFAAIVVRPDSLSSSIYFIPTEPAGFPAHQINTNGRSDYFQEPHEKGCYYLQRFRRLLRCVGLLCPQSYCYCRGKGSCKQPQDTPPCRPLVCKVFDDASTL